MILQGVLGLVSVADPCFMRTTGWLARDHLQVLFQHLLTLSLLIVLAFISSWFSSYQKVKRLQHRSKGRVISEWKKVGIRIVRLWSDYRMGIIAVGHDLE